MVARSKLYTQLDVLEAELRVNLLTKLKRAALGENDLIFCAEPFNEHKALKNKTDHETEYLVEIGARILALRKKTRRSHGKYYC